MSANYLYNVCAAKLAFNLVDAIAVIFLIGYMIVCAKKGFVTCFFGLISTTVALIVAVALAKPILGWTNGLFGLQETLQGKFFDTFSKVEAFNKLVSAEGLEAAMVEHDISGILINLVMKSLDPNDLLEGTTLAVALSETTAMALSVLIAGAAVFLLCKLVFLILKSVLNGIVEKMSVLGALNGVLGAAVGLVQGVLVICSIVAFVTLLPIDGLADFITNCTVVKFLYENNFVIMLTSVFL